MKKLTLFFIATFFFANTHALPAEKDRSFFQKIFCGENDKHAACQTTSNTNINTNRNVNINVNTHALPAKKNRSFFQKIFCGENDKHAVCQTTNNTKRNANKQVKIKKIKETKIYLTTTKKVRTSQFTQELLIYLIKRVMIKLT